MNQNKNNVGNGIGTGAALGVVFGFLYGNQSENQSISIAFGLAIGVTFGAIIDIIRNQKTTTFMYKYRKEIVSSTTKVVDAGKDFVLQQKENLEDLVAETKE